MTRFAATPRHAFAADAMVLTDRDNPSTDIPGLTVSQRGLIELDVVCEAIESDVHSGLCGGADMA